MLAKLFEAYPTFNKAKVIKDKLTQKNRGYGFASFSDPFECVQAMKDCNGQFKAHSHAAHTAMPHTQHKHTPFTRPHPRTHSPRTGKYVGNRPVKLTKSKWEKRTAAPQKKGRKRGAKHAY